MSAYEVGTYRVPVGVRALAVRLGRALENWGHEGIEPLDAAMVQRELHRQNDLKTRMMADRLIVRNW